MKICKSCFREFDEDENLYDCAATELTDTFLDCKGDGNLNDLCPQCKEELGMLNLMGFGQ
jgi:hypothetical protein